MGMIMMRHRSRGPRKEAEAPLLLQMEQIRRQQKDRVCRELATNVEPVVRNATVLSRYATLAIPRNGHAPTTSLQRSVVSSQITSGLSNLRLPGCSKRFQKLRQLCREVCLF
jgi:hypothetical protein